MGYSSEELKNEIGSEVLSSHSCRENFLPEYLHVLKIRRDESKEEGSWELLNLQKASQTDVSNMAAHSDGEFMSITSVKINYCPFCGEHLVN